jgi:hypothetical protein
MALALYFFWLLPVPVLIVTAAVMYRRKQHLIYPVFWGYLCFQFLSLIIEFVCKLLSFKAYFYAYWTSSFGILIFNLVLLRTIFAIILRKYSALDRVRRIGFEVALVTIWCAALLLTFRMTMPGRFLQKIMKAELVVSFTAVAMFLFVVAASRLLGIRWTSQVAGIATGLGLIGTADLAIYALWSRGSNVAAHSQLASWLSTLALDTAVGIFAFYFVPHRPEPQAPDSARRDLLEWSETMKEGISK